jgi:hypothetical protein
VFLANTHWDSNDKLYNYEYRRLTMAGGLGTRLFVQGDVISAADVNGYLMNQSMMRFPTTAARDTAFGNGIAVGVTVGGVAGDGKPLLQEGMFAYIDFNNDVTFFNGSQWVSAPTFVLADGEVTTVKIADDAVTGDKIADGAVTSAHIANGTVIAADIAAGTITATELADGAVTSGKILNDTIVNADISASASIVDTKLATISSSGKVSNSATTATDANTALAIVARDASGNFIAGKATLATVDVNTVVETASIVAAASTGTINIEFSTNPTVYYTSNATANWTLNVRGTSGVTLNDTLTTGQIATVTFLATNGATPYRPTVFQVDGSAITPKWMGGTAPSAGNASSIDAYTLAIIKTGSAAFTMLASQTRFA